MYVCALCSVCVYVCVCYVVCVHVQVCVCVCVCVLGVCENDCISCLLLDVCLYTTSNCMLCNLALCKPYLLLYCTIFEATCVIHTLWQNRSLKLEPAAVATMLTPAW